MSLAERFADFKPPRLGGECRVCVLLRDLPKGESQALADALTDARYSNASLSKILAAEGYQVAGSTVGRHRRGECKGVS